MPSAIEVRGLSKQFGPVRAVNDLSFEVAPGRVTGFLGPNGSGKTTTLRMLLGLVSITDGTATFGGRRYVDIDKPIHHVGAVLEATSFHPSRRAEDHLKMVAIGAGIPRARVDETLALVGLSDVARRRVGKFSLGMRRPARRSGDPDPRRTLQRPRPPGHPVVAHVHPAPGVDRARRAGLVPPPLRDGGDRR
jgi:ABC-2 type transport system ATP-binding protein